MSRIGKRVLKIPNDVTIENNDNKLTVKGPKGSLTLPLSSLVTVNISDEITVERKKETKISKQMHGTTNANIQNMLKGVTEGFEKSLEILGVGYRFSLKDDKLIINAGYSNPKEITIPKGLTVESISNTEIIIKGIDKQLVGELAANIRKVRKPEPYKGKGIRYKGEIIRRKEGKKATK